MTTGTGTGTAICRKPDIPVILKFAISFFVTEQLSRTFGGRNVGVTYFHMKQQYCVSFVAIILRNKVLRLGMVFVILMEFINVTSNVYYPI